MIIYYTHSYGGRKGESHELLEKAIAVFTGRSAAAGEFVESLRTSGQYGKPVIDGFRPFSISHSRSSWAVLIADKECGLDIQHHRKCDAGVIAKRFYSKEDSQHVESLIEAGLDPDEEFFRIWARREALVKAVGGSVVETDLPSVLSDEIMLNEEMWFLRDIVIPGCENLAAAVCSHEPDERITIRELK